MKRIALLFFVMAALVAAAPAAALSLDEAKAQGLVGEKPDGYLGVVQASPEADALVSDINAKRKAKYAEIATKRGTQIAAVEALAGKKAIEETPPGRFVQDPPGQWRKK